MIFIIVINNINHRIHNQNFFFIFFNIHIINKQSNDQIDRNNQTGYVAWNLFNSLSMFNGLIQTSHVQGFQITLSHNSRKIHNGTKLITTEKNKISIQTFLFSFLLILLKNIFNAIVAHIINPTK